MVKKVYYLMTPFFSRSSFVNHLILLFCENINYKCILLVFKPFNYYCSHHLDLIQHKTINKKMVWKLCAYRFIFCLFFHKIKRTNEVKCLYYNVFWSKIKILTLRIEPMLLPHLRICGVTITSMTHICLLTKIYICVCVCVCARARACVHLFIYICS